MPLAKKHLIGDITTDTVVYRVFPLMRAEQLFADMQMTLVRPEKWDDPCENQLYNLNLIDEKTKKPVNIEHMRQSYYGLCWTLAEESDAMWRIYSPDHTAVRFRTTIGRLRKAFIDSDDPFASLKFFLGRVSYLSSNEFGTMFSDGGSCFSAILDTSGDSAIQSLLVKRDSFSHEKEIRMIFHEPESSVDHGMVWGFPIDPHEIFDQICFDSRLPPSCFNTNFKKFRETYGFNAEIVRSTLYDIPKPKVVYV